MGTRVPGIKFVQGRNDYTDADGLHFGIAIHNTSNNASDENEASYATRRTDGISSHFYVDKDSVTQSLELEDRAGHAGSANGNNNSIAVEITGGNAWTRAQWLSNVAWDKLATVLAWVIKNDPDYKANFKIRRASVEEMKSNPKVKAFYGHDDMRRAWGGTTHTDPGPNFPWDHLIAKVSAAVGGTGTTGGITVADSNLVVDMGWRLNTLMTGQTTTQGGPSKGQRVWLVDQINAMQKTLGALTAALTAALNDADKAEILAAIKKAADEDAARDAQDAARDEALRALVQSYQSGGATAEQVLAKLGEMLSDAASAEVPKLV